MKNLQEEGKTLNKPLTHRTLETFKNTSNDLLKSVTNNN